MEISIKSTEGNINIIVELKKITFETGAKLMNSNCILLAVEEFKNDYEGTWAKFADEKIDWFKKYDTVLDESNAPFYKWFSGGQMNVAYQCVDRHLKTKKNKAAIIFEGDNGDQEIITYRELAYRVSKTANMFKNQFNIKKIS